MHQITVLPHTLKLDFTDLLLRGGDEREGRGGSGKERERGCPVFFTELTCQPMHLLDDAQMLLAREQTLTVNP